MVCWVQNSAVWRLWRELIGPQLLRPPPCHPVAIDIFIILTVVLIIIVVIIIVAFIVITIIRCVASMI